MGFVIFRDSNLEWAFKDLKMDIEELLQEINTRELVQLTSELVRIPSHKNVAGRETEVNLYIAAWLISNGFNVNLAEIEGVPVPVARIAGRTKDNSLLLNGHSDTAIVDFMDNPFSGAYDDDFVYGRGTADMKAGLAAMMIALRTFKRHFQPSTDVYFLASTHEETGECPASKELIKSLPVRYCIVGEPTNLQLEITNKGLYFFKLISIGKSAHLSVPQRGINAIDNLIYAINALGDTYFRQRTEETGGQSLFILCNIKGGTEGIPDYAEALYNRRTVRGDSFANDRRNIEDTLQKLKANIPNLAIRVEHHTGYEKELEPMDAPADPQFVRIFHAILSQKFDSQIIHCQGWTEGSIFRAHGIDTVIFGPGKVEDAHTPNERIAIQQLRQATEGYLRLLVGHHMRYDNAK